MTHLNQTQPQPKPVKKTKKEYSQPELVTYGKVSALTQSGSKVGGEGIDPALGNFKNKN